MSSLWINPLEFSKAWLDMLVTPWWWLACFLSACQIMYTRHKEKKHFGSYIETSIPLILRTLVFGIGTGVILSIIFSFFRFPFSPKEVAIVWFVTLFFTLAGIRFSSISYSVGFLALVNIFFQFYPVSLPGKWNQLIIALNEVHYSIWLWLVAGFHIVEWLLIRIDGAKGNYPVLMKHASKEVVNGFMLRKSWPIPLLLLGVQGGFLPVPMLLSFSRLTLTKPLEQQKRLTSTFHLLLGIIILLLMTASYFFTPFLWIAAFVTFFGHEAVYQLGKLREKRDEPLFVSNERGLKVFAVLPNSPAMVMGVKIGDVIQRLNGTRIYTHADLEKAVKDAAFCKLEVLDEYLDRHMMQKVLYQDDPRHLGIVGAVPIGDRDDEKEQKEIS